MVGSRLSVRDYHTVHSNVEPLSELREDMGALVLNLLLLLGGIYFGLRGVYFLHNESALRAYMQSSPKASLWVLRYGVDDATKMARESFIPLSFVISLAMIGFGAWNLWRILK